MIARAVSAASDQPSGPELPVERACESVESASRGLQDAHHKPLLNSTVSYGKSLNLSSSFLGEMDARCGKVAIAGGRKTSSEVPIRPVHDDGQRNCQPVRMRPRRATHPC